MSRVPSRRAARRASPLDDVERRLADRLGDLIRFWGFGPHAGRVWALLYLSPRSLSAPELAARLEMSAGNLSQTLTLLERWGVIRRYRAPGRKLLLHAENDDVWSSVSRVLNERELEMVRDLDALLSELIDEVDRAVAAGADPERARHQRRRLRALQRLTRAGATLVRAVIAASHFDLSRLRGVMRLVRGGDR